MSCQSNDETSYQELANGKEVYITNCISCHGENGEGINGLYPSLIKPDGIIEAHTHRAARLIKYGSAFGQGMKPVSLSSKEIAEVINYIQNNWGNKAEPVSRSQVDAILINKPW